MLSEHCSHVNQISQIFFRVGGGEHILHSALKFSLPTLSFLSFLSFHQPSVEWNTLGQHCMVMVWTLKEQNLREGCVQESQVEEGAGKGGTGRDTYRAENGGKKRDVWKNFYFSSIYQMKLILRWVFGHIAFSLLFEKPPIYQILNSSISLCLFCILFCLRVLSLCSFAIFEMWFNSLKLVGYFALLESLLLKEV